MLVGWYRQ